MGQSARLRRGKSLYASDVSPDWAAAVQSMNETLEAGCRNPTDMRLSAYQVEDRLLRAAVTIGRLQ